MCVLTVLLLTIFTTSDQDDPPPSSSSPWHFFKLPAQPYTPVRWLFPDWPISSTCNCMHWKTLCQVPPTAIFITSSFKLFSPFQGEAEHLPVSSVRENSKKLKSIYIFELKWAIPTTQQSVGSKLGAFTFWYIRLQAQYYILIYIWLQAQDYI